jgi:cardiolipin synthase A/B
MLVDDAWATIGSANLHRYSLLGNGELNAAIWAPETVHAFRVALFEEHLATDTAALDDVAALRLFAETARANRRKWKSASTDWQGIAFALDLPTYGQEPQF